MSKQVVVVLGMHKSGTTLVAQILHRSGIVMGEAEDVDGDYDKGVFHERTPFRELNQAILGFGDPAFLNPCPADLRLGAEDRRRMRALIEEADALGGSWGFKDPRTCLTYRLWEEELPPHKAVVVYRPPEEVWGHLNRHPLTSWQAWPALRAWCEHNQPLIELIESGRRAALLVNFVRLMTSDAEFRRLERFLDIPLIDLRDPRRRRSHTRADLPFQTASALRRLIRQPSARSIYARLEEMRALQCAAEAAGPESS